MPEISTEPLNRFLGMSLPASEGELLNQLKVNQAYWERRRQTVTSLLGSTALAPDVLVEQILQGELLMPAAWQLEEYLSAKRLALEAVAADPTLEGANRFQKLARIETGKESVSGFRSHEEVINSLLGHTSSYTPDGLILHLNFTDKERGATSTRKFISATPYNVDLGRLGLYVFDKRPSTEPYSLDTLSFSEDSGLHFRYSMDVLGWQKAHGLTEQQSFRTYGIYTANNDASLWVKYGGAAWSASAYPEHGPAVFWGQEEISEFIVRMMSYGGNRLAKIQADIGDYPGFEFIHDIEPTGKLGTDTF